MENDHDELGNSVNKGSINQMDFNTDVKYSGSSINEDPTYNEDYIN